MLFTTQVVRKTKRLAHRTELVLALAEGANPEGAAAITALAQEVGAALTELSIIDDAHIILLEIHHRLWQRARSLQLTQPISNQMIHEAFDWPYASTQMWSDCPLVKVDPYIDDEGDDDEGGQ